MVKTGRGREPAPDTEQDSDPEATDAPRFEVVELAFHEYTRARGRNAGATSNLLGLMEAPTGRWPIRISTELNCPSLDVGKEGQSNPDGPRKKAPSRRPWMVYSMMGPARVERNSLVGSTPPVRVKVGAGGSGQRAARSMWNHPSWKERDWKVEIW